MELIGYLEICVRVKWSNGEKNLTGVRSRENEGRGGGDSKYDNFFKEFRHNDNQRNEAVAGRRYGVRGKCLVACLRWEILQNICIFIQISQ